jgi:transcription initiation factor TFIID subunit 6
MPAIITCLIAKRLGDPQRSTPRETYALRDLAVSLLKRVLDRYSSSYYTMKPRTARALLQAFLDNNKPFTTHYGAVAGLRVMGREVVRSLVIPNLRIYGDVVLAPALGDEGDISVREDAERVLDTIMVSPHPPSPLSLVAP